MDPLRHLNFLKIKPLINWLDYFLDRKEFSNFLEDEKGNKLGDSESTNYFI